jgi:hypothetical protein
MTAEILIPPFCYVPKPYFKVRPGPTLIQEIKDFIARTGQPHMWRGHTHTRPEKGSRIEYLEEYNLPETLHKSEDNWAPCPCCSPTRPKYYRGGKIGWFPDEGVIRNMGPDCFKSFDKEGHLRALAQLRKEQELARAINLLMVNLPKVPIALEVFEQALPAVHAVDDVRKTLRRELSSNPQDQLLGPYPRRRSPAEARGKTGDRLRSNRWLSDA